MGQPQGFNYVLRIRPELHGRTVKSLLQSELKLSTRLLRNGAMRDSVKVNGKSTYLNQRAAEGDEISFMLPMEHSEVPPEPMQLDVRYEDSEVIVVNKPPGVLTHPTAKERTGSLLAGVAAYLAPQHLVPHSIHRLDRDTSGVVIFAKHAHIHHLFDIALRRGDMHRMYTALVEHEDAFDIGTVGEWRTIDLPIAQDPNRPSRRIISAAGQRSITHYRVLSQAAGISAVQIVLETGRTHQIRVHFSAMGMPLVGDPSYGAKPSSRAIQTRPWQAFLRQALHAVQLAWLHPIDKETRLVKAGVASDIQELWRTMQGDEGIWGTLMADETSLLTIKTL